MKKIKRKIASQDESSVSPDSTAFSIPMNLLGSESEIKLPERKKTNISKAAEQMRRNRSATIRRTDEYANIKSGINPFNDSDEYGRSCVDTSEAIKLCQLAYHNFAIFYNTIEMMVEFSMSNIRFRGKNEKANLFFANLFKRIDLDSLQDQFYRERYRSGNTFIFRHEVKASPADVSRMNQVYGESEESLVVAAKDSVLLPIKYEILNPAEIKTPNGVTYLSRNYYKALTDYEIQYLKNRNTEEAKLLFDSLSKETQQAIDGLGTGVLMELKPENIIFSFFNKQDYEPFATPMGFRVLRDINWKEELKNMDMALARTIQQSILLVTNGAEKDKGGIDKSTIQGLVDIFSNESIGRVLVADYTTKVSFVIPQIADILDPVKYQVVNEDIRIGLHNILVGNEKFANQASKVNLFLEKLRASRESFLRDFLIPEVKRISLLMGFKTYPEPYFDEQDLKDEVEYARIYTRLYEVGVLTPEETLNAIKTGLLPEPEDSLKSQEALSKLRKQERYLPITYFQKDKPEATGGVNGRPKGAKKKQTTKKIKPLGAKQIIDVAKKIDSFEKTFNNELLSQNEGKILTVEDNLLASKIRRSILMNENIDNIEKVCASYIKEKKTDVDRLVESEVLEICEDNKLNENAALIIYHSQNIKE